MCLATVYGKKEDTESILCKNVSKIEIEGTAITLIDIVGQETVIEGTVVMVDLANSIVKINCISE